MTCAEMPEEPGLLSSIALGSFLVLAELGMSHGVRGMHRPRHRAIAVPASNPVFPDRTLPRPRALPDDAGETLKRNQCAPQISPVTQFRDGRMIKRLTPGPGWEQCSGNIHHVRRNSAFVCQRRATTSAKASRGARSVVVIPIDTIFAIEKAKPLAPAADIGRISRTMGKPAGLRMIVPGPARRKVDLKPHRPAEASSHHRFRPRHPICLGCALSHRRLHHARATQAAPDQI